MIENNNIAAITKIPFVAAFLHARGFHPLERPYGFFLEKQPFLIGIAGLLVENYLSIILYDLKNSVYISAASIIECCLDNNKMTIDELRLPPSGASRGDENKFLSHGLKKLQDLRNGICSIDLILDDLEEISLKEKFQHAKKFDASALKVKLGLD